MSILEQSNVRLNTLLTQIELERLRIDTEKIKMLDEIRSEQRAIRSKIDRFSGRMESTRSGDE